MEKDDFREWFGNLYNNRENYIEYIRNMVDQHEYTVFYGCGLMYKSVLDAWNKYVGRQLDFCCDRDPNKWGKSFGGVKCISPDELFRIKDKCTVFITTECLVDVYKYLKSQGVDSVHEIYYYSLIISEELSMDIEKACCVYKMLEDDKSRYLLRAMIKRVFDIKNSHFVMVDFFEKNQYFPSDIIQMSAHESFVDAGAYTGDTLSQFLNIVKGKFDDYYAFELDEQIFKSLKTNVADLENNLNIKVFNEGLWDKKGIINYSSGDMCSAIGKGDKTGSVVKLDDVLGNARVTFIKMDIEGAELNALRGAENIIRSQKPVLAICVYHRLRDIWEIPLYIKRLYPEYKIYFRHHSEYEYDTICYAIPEGK